MKTILQVIFYDLILNTNCIDNNNYYQKKIMTYFQIFLKTII